MEEEDGKDCIELYLVHPIEAQQGSSYDICCI